MLVKLTPDSITSNGRSLSVGNQVSFAQFYTSSINDVTLIWYFLTPGALFNTYYQYTKSSTPCPIWMSVTSFMNNHLIDVHALDLVGKIKLMPKLGLDWSLSLSKRMRPIDSFECQIIWKNDIYLKRIFLCLWPCVWLIGHSMHLNNTWHFFGWF